VARGGSATEKGGNEKEATYDVVFADNSVLTSASSTSGTGASSLSTRVVGRSGIPCTEANRSHTSCASSFVGLVCCGNGVPAFN
jgi:hypothetical protein